MGYSAITQPDQYMGAFSAVPLKLFDTDYSISENYKYIVNVCYDTVTVSGQTTYVSGVNVWTQLNTIQPHNYNVGDEVFLNDKLNNNLYTGYFFVKKIISSTSFVVNVATTEPFGNNDFTTSKFIRYKVPPDLDGFAKINFSNLLKDFVTYNITGDTVNYTLPYEGIDTRFDYNLICGAEKTYRYQFSDNIFYTGNTVNGVDRVGFVNSGLTNVNQTEFKVGDRIKIEQEIYGWPYVDNAFQGFNVGFSGLTTPPFLVNSEILVTGQVTHPTYNGETTVLQITGNQLEIPKIWQGNTPTEPGIIYGVPVPSYNTVGIITTIYVDPVAGLVIGTDIPWDRPTPAIGGFMTYADNRVSVIYDELTLSGLSVFNAYVDKKDYAIDFYDKYVVQNRALTLNNISTLLNNNQPYRIEPSSIGFLLLHQGDNSPAQGMTYEFYDENNNVLGSIIITASTEDTYFPLSVEQIANSGYVDTCYPCDWIGLRFKWGGSPTDPFEEAILEPQGLWNGRPYWKWTRQAGGPADQFLTWDPTSFACPAWVIRDGASVPGVVERMILYPTVTGDTGCAPFSVTTLNLGYSCDYKDSWNGVYYAEVQTRKIGGVCDEFANYSGDVKSYCMYAGEYTGIATGGTMTQWSNKVCFELNDDCSKYEIYHLMWVDKYGSIITMPFKYVSRDGLTVNRSEYYQQPGTWENDTFDYKDYGRGQKDFYVRGRKTLTLNSGWLKDFERELVGDLIHSSAVFVQTPDNRVFAGKLQQTNVELYKEINEDLFSYTFDFTFSTNSYRF